MILKDIFDFVLMGEILFVLIVIFLLLDFLLERLLDYLDSRLWSVEIPAELLKIYDADKYKKSQQYEKVKTHFGTFTATFSLILILFMLFCGGFAYVAELAAEVTDNSILHGLIFFAILFYASDFLGIPFSAWFIFNIEERFGFNKTTVRTFITDKLKAWIIGALFGGGLLSLVIWLYSITGVWFWLLAWGAISVFSLFMQMFYSQLIVPLFNKQKPLEDGELRVAIENFCTKVGFKLTNVYVIDGSKRSKKANAYFTGFGPKKRIVLYDTLIAEHSIEELVAVLAHEIGHYKKKHTVIGLFVSLITTGLMLYIFSLVVALPELSGALGATVPSFHLSLLAFGMLYGPLSLVLGLVMNVVSRRNEYVADRYATENYSAEALQSALIRLSVNNLSNLRPHPANVFFHYSHPPLLKRLQSLQKNN